MDKIVKQMLHSMPSFKLKLYVFFKSLIFPFSRIERIIPKGNIAEIGCSYGLTSAYLALKNKNIKVVGTDSSKERIKLAKNIWGSVSNLKFITKDLLKNTTVKKNQVILAIDLFHHLTHEQQEQFISDCYNCFDKTNTLIIKEIDKTPFPKFMLNYAGDLLMNPGDLNFKSSKILKKQLERTGFEVGYKDIKHPLYPHYLLICRKI